MRGEHRRTVLGHQIRLDELEAQTMPARRLRTVPTDRKNTGSDQTLPSRCLDCGERCCPHHRDRRASHVTQGPGLGVGAVGMNVARCCAVLRTISRSSEKHSRRYVTRRIAASGRNGCAADRSLSTEQAPSGDGTSAAESTLAQPGGHASAGHDQAKRAHRRTCFASRLRSTISAGRLQLHREGKGACGSIRTLRQVG